MTRMITRLLPTFLAAIALGACGVDSTPQSSGSPGATTQASGASAPPAAQDDKKDEPKAEASTASPPQPPGKDTQ